MKRLLCLMIILVVAFGATAPVYAEAWTSQQASTVTSGVTGLLAQLANLDIHFQNWATLLGTGGSPAYFHSFQDLYNRIDWALGWIVPDTLHGQSDPTIMDSIIVLTNYAMNHLPDISSIAGYVASWMSTNNSHLNYIERALVQYSPFNNSLRYENAHYQLVNSDGSYSIPFVTGSNANWNDVSKYWSHGSPIGNIGYMLNTHMRNYLTNNKINYDAFFPHYNDQLSTWDSQGDSLQQVLFTPDSAIQGLYRYLAFVQRDVARMTFIIADPHEQAGMENANDSGVADMYADVYDADNGGVTLSDMSDTFNTQKVAKQTFNTGVQFSTNGLFSFTDDGNWGFWSTAVKNDMDNVPMTRKSESYDSTAYDAQLEELCSIWGIKDGK